MTCHTQGLAPSFALGSLCVLASFVWMVDLVWSVMDLLPASKDRK